MNNKPIACATLTALALVASAPGDAAERQINVPNLIMERCSICHADDLGRLVRISAQRKTPEGWLMTVVRMQQQHDLGLSDDERRALVKYLADTQGLAPAETEGARYVLERRLNTVENFSSEQFTQMCARCHSGARVALQRRTATEWERLVNFHLSQFPTLEYQALGRDRDWFGIATNEIVPYLAKNFAYGDEQWQKWKQTPRAPVAGEWSLSGHLPGRGDFNAVMSVSQRANDHYALELRGNYADGGALIGQGAAVVYTGYEWRGKVEINGVEMRQVFALKGDILEGRMFVADHDEVGADVLAARQDGGASRVLAVQPSYLKTGTATELSIIGSNFDGELVLPAGIKVEKLLSRTPGRIVIRALADKRALGTHQVKVGAAEGGELAVFDKLDRIEVVPPYAIARVGGNGGPAPKVDARFEALAWAKGPRGEYRVGYVPAKWSVAPFNEDAKRDRDVEFAGSIDAKTGVFTPSFAGPNPLRHLMTNNAGNLAVIAEISAGGKPLTAQGQLIVTVQRWNNPPIP
ncbi:MAG: quinohemoprotein amine dehydrogenase subunit alpha [Azoarcus sp.]|nr:quinohemoprotein amine dehydrogenase subunit alpha [Azoarcus sp.]